MWNYGTDGTLTDWETGASAAPGANSWWGASQPSASDSGVDYGSAVLDIFKFGVGVLATRNQAEWEDKRRFESARDGLALQGQAAQMSALGNQSGLSGMLPMLLIGGAVLAVVMLVAND